MITKKKLQKYLIELYPDQFDRKRSLEAWLIRFVCSNPYYLDTLRDITKHGCISGCLNPLIYHDDCRRFYDRYETKIWDVIEEFRNDTGQSFGQFLDSFKYAIDNETALKTYLAWFAIEEIAYRILNHFEEE